jgi:NAD(P)-dependent dehydrogenase (short-subunit alcohol dehydrogenase family)
MLIDQKIAIIGGTSGIGFAVADAALDAGAEVIIGSSSQTKIEEASAKFSETGQVLFVDGGSAII